MDLLDDGIVVGRKVVSGKNEAVQLAGDKNWPQATRPRQICVAVVFIERYEVLNSLVIDGFDKFETLAVPFGQE